jgi:hypothetical protein
MHRHSKINFNIATGFSLCPCQRETLRTIYIEDALHRLILVCKRSNSHASLLRMTGCIQLVFLGAL